jgi:hypothetical protein
MTIPHDAFDDTLLPLEGEPVFLMRRILPPPARGGFAPILDPAEDEDVGWVVIEVYSTSDFDIADPWGGSEPGAPAPWVGCRPNDLPSPISPSTADQGTRLTNPIPSDSEPG